MQRATDEQMAGRAIARPRRRLNRSASNESGSFPNFTPGIGGQPSAPAAFNFAPQTSQPPAPFGSGTSAFGAANSQATAASAPSVGFNFGGVNSPPVNFGSGSSSQSSNAPLGSPGLNPPTSPFGAAPSTGGFGGSAASPSAAPTQTSPVVTFGSPSQQSVGSPPPMASPFKSQPSFNFGTTSAPASAPAAAPAPASTSAFGAAAPAQTSPVFSFSAPATTSAPSTSTAAAAPASTPAPAFGTSSQAPIFSFTPKSTPASTPAASAPTFGVAPAPATTSAPTFSFSLPAAASTASSTATTAASSAAPAPSFTPFTSQPAAAVVTSSPIAPSLTAPASAASTASPSTAESASTGSKRKSGDDLQAPAAKFVHGKSKLSQSISAEDLNKAPSKAPAADERPEDDTAPATGLSAASRKRSVDHGEEAPKKRTSVDASQDKENQKQPATSKPESPFKSNMVEVSNKPATESSFSVSSKTNDVFGKPTATPAEQTVVQAKVTKPEEVERRTRYYELAENAQNELNYVYQFIHDQVDLCKKIETQQLAHNGELIDDVSQRSDACLKETQLLKEHQESTKVKIETLSGDNEYQIKNAAVAKLFVDENMPWKAGQRPKTTGVTVHREYFFSTVTSLEKRCRDYLTTVNQLEDRMAPMHASQHQHQQPSPQHIPELIRDQGKALLTLAARVAGLHQRVEKLQKSKI